MTIYAFKLGLTPALSDEEYDYTFNVAEALGANHLTMELPTDGALTKRIGEFAAKRKMMVGYHRLMKKEQYRFPATIELEYPVPEGSTRVAEIGRCLDFCKHALGSPPPPTAGHG